VNAFDRFADPGQGYVSSSGDSLPADVALYVLSIFGV